MICARCRLRCTQFTCAQYPGRKCTPSSGRTGYPDNGRVAGRDIDPQVTLGRRSVYRFAKCSVPGRDAFPRSGAPELNRARAEMALAFEVIELDRHHAAVGRRVTSSRETCRARGSMTPAACGGAWAVARKPRNRVSAPSAAFSGGALHRGLSADRDLQRRHAHGARDPYSGAMTYNGSYSLQRPPFAGDPSLGGVCRALG
jgi:hypothetical protein